jgi:hypothetical protein
MRTLLMGSLIAFIASVLLVADAHAIRGGCGLWRSFVPSDCCGVDMQYQLACSGGGSSCFTQIGTCELGCPFVQSVGGCPQARRTPAGPLYPAKLELAAESVPVDAARQGTASACGIGLKKLEDWLKRPSSRVR